MNERLISSGILLNFARTPFILPDPWMGQECTYATMEHYFQAMKSIFSLEMDWKEAHDWIIDTSDPSVAKSRGRRLLIDHESWDLAAFGFMLLGQKAKFFQHKEARVALLATNDDRLIEHRPDKIWGDNMDGSGLNLCGRSLMMVRAIVRSYFT